MKRDFYNILKKWKAEGMLKPLMVVGARQIGKTYIIDEFCKKEFKQYVYINLLEKNEVVKIFEEKIDFEDKVRKLELEINQKLDDEDFIIFFDEIQESEELISHLKSFCESDKKYNIVCAGSLLGVKINRFNSSFPVGKVQIEHMYQMNFEEFLRALKKDMWIEEIRRCYKNMERISIHEKLMRYYRYFLCIGGMPEAVKNFVEVDEEILLFNDKIIKNIITSYLADMNKYTVNNVESVKIEKIYNQVPLSLAKENKKFKYIDIDKNAKKRDYESSIDWLKASKLVLKCNLVETVQIPLKVYEKVEHFKLYLSDCGLLTSLLEIKFNDIMLDKNFIYKGVLAENYIAQTLASKNISLYYWKSQNMAELDFLLYNDDGIIPVEVKANINNKSKSLNSYIEKYNPAYAIRISGRNFGFENNIKSIPLYAAYLIE